MSITTGQIALMKRVATMPDAPNIVWPNHQGQNPDGSGMGLPRFVMQVSGGAQRTATIGGVTDATPEIVVRVETQADAYSTENDALVAALVARFPVALRFDGLTIMEAPSVRPVLPDSSVYAVPVIIRARFSF